MNKVSIIMIIQKGFTPNLSGTLEHTVQMTNIINNARIKQRSLVITLLDLKNAFGMAFRYCQYYVNFINTLKLFTANIKSFDMKSNCTTLSSSFKIK